MKSKYVYNINSYEELKEIKQELKLELEEQVSTLKESNFVKIASFFNKEEPATSKTDTNEGSAMGSIGQTLASLDLKEFIKSPLGSLLGSFLIRNRSTRKFFIAFIVGKEMFPFLLTKFKEMLSKEDTVKE